MKAWKLIMASFTIVTVLSGCEMTPARYKVLSFFFDGVPNPEETKSAVQAKDSEGAGGKNAKVSVWTHGPYAAKLCDACHERGSNNLVVPIQELCLRCHNIKMTKKYVHGPLVAGGCTVCHEPHSSRYQYLLVSEPEGFCFYCHDKKAIEEKDVHKGAGTNCTLCHNAHMSDKKYLLK